MNIDVKSDEHLWEHKYRPRKIADTILPERMKRIFQTYIDEGSIQNLLLNGGPGSGKTTAAMAMLEELGCDYIKINGSLNGGIDTLRYEISNFASTVSFSGNRKYVIIDEADGLTPSIQAALRSFIDDYSKNCGFIFTCNLKNKIIEPLRDSRFTVIDYKIDSKEKPKLAAQFFKRVVAILEMENVEYDPKIVAKVIEKSFPNYRRILGDLQQYAKGGKIDDGIFIDLKQESIDELFRILKEKKFNEMRKWVADNIDMDPQDIFRKMYDTAPSKIEMSSMPGFVVTMSEYMYKHAFVADPEINMVAFLTEVFMEAKFK